VVILLFTILLRNIGLESYRAIIPAITTTGAFFFIYGPCLFPDFNLEFSGVPGHFLYLGIGQQPDVGVPTRLNHLGGKDTHGAIICRESFIQLGHPAADAGCLFDKVYLKPHIGQVKGRLDTSDTTTDYQNRLFCQIQSLQLAEGYILSQDGQLCEPPEV
jgi:hypothetical protein